jgi:hypothetical protein
MKAFAEGSSNPSALDGAMHCVGALQGSLQTGKVAEQYSQQGSPFFFLFFYSEKSRSSTPSKAAPFFFILLFGKVAEQYAQCGNCFSKVESSSQLKRPLQCSRQTDRQTHTHTSPMCSKGVCVCVRACACACVRACVRARVRACVRVRVRVCERALSLVTE